MIYFKVCISQIDESTNIARDFKAVMLDAINSRFTSYQSFDETNRSLILAAISLPRFKTNFIATEANILYAKSLLTAECRAFRLGSEENLELQIGNDAGPVCDDFIVSFASSREIRRSSMDIDIESEVNRFLADTRKEDEILKEYPTIRKIYMKYNTTLSSSAAVERVFSNSQLIFTPRRNRLSAKHFEQVLLLKQNKKLPMDKD